MKELFQTICQMSVTGTYVIILVSVCSLLSFGKDSVKKRILRVLQYKKASVWAVGIAAVLLLVVGAGLFFNPRKGIPEQEAIRLVEEAGTNDNSAIDEFVSDEAEEATVTDLQLQWRNLLQEQGATAARADEWWEVLKSDGLILSDSYEFTDLRTGDWDQNGKVDLAFVISIRPGVISHESYARNTLYIYMNGKQAYYKAVSDYPLYSIGTLLGGDVDRDGYQEVVYSAFTGGVGGSGSWYKEILKYRNGNLTPMEFPDDLEEADDKGIQVNVAYGPGGAGADYYTAYCPLLDETIYFVAENLRREDGTLAESYGKEGEPAGGNVRGFYDFALVYEEAENRFYLKAYEYLCGEGGPSHEVGTAVFTLDWKTDGTPIVLDFAIEP